MDFGAMRGRGRRAWWLIAAALLGIVIGAWVLCMHGLGDRETDKTPPKARMHFKCLLCGHGFVKDRGEFQAEVGDLDDRPEGSRALVDCPSCKRRRCCGAMIRCPNCGKYFLPLERVRGPGADPSVLTTRPNNICTHCGTDIARWHEERSEGK